MASIYLVYEDYFEILHVDVDIMTESSIEIQVDKNIDKVYNAFSYDEIYANTKNLGAYCFIIKCETNT